MKPARDKECLPTVLYVLTVPVSCGVARVKVVSASGTCTVSMAALAVCLTLTQAYLSPGTWSPWLPQQRTTAQSGPMCIQVGTPPPFQQHQVC